MSIPGKTTTTLEGNTASAPQAPPTAPQRESASSPEAFVRDEQSVLAGAVQRLRDTLDCASVVAWTLRNDGAPYVAAASFEGPPPEAPSPAAFAAAGALGRTTLLERESVPETLAGLASRRVAMAPVVASDGSALAVLLVTARGPEGLRPRDLAVVDTAAQRIAGPLAAAKSARRLGQLDAEILRMDRLATLGTLAAEIAHEVRNPLVSVKTFLQLLPERQDDPEFVERFLAVASGELRRIERLLDLMVEYPRSEEAEARASASAAVETIGDLLLQLTRSRGVRLEFEIDGELPDVAIRADALRQVLMNLALHAIDATAEGGVVQVAARCAGGRVEISVSDAGSGVPVSERSRVFEPFRGPETGPLGLAISRRLVEEAGGEIRVEDAPDGGARFALDLPAAP